MRKIKCLALSCAFVLSAGMTAAGATTTLGWIDYPSSAVLGGTNDIAITPAGDVLIVGTAPTSISPNGRHDTVVRRYGVDGTLRWERLFGTAGEDYGAGVVALSSGGILVSGVTTGTFPGARPNSGEDVFLLRLDPDGNQIWTRQYAAPGEETPAHLELDERGRVYMTVATSTGSEVRKYSDAGRLIWSRALSGLPLGLAVEGAQVYVTHGAAPGAPSAELTTLQAWSLSGAPRWSATFAGDDRVFDVAASSGRVYTTGTSAAGPLLRTYQADGTPMAGRPAVFGRVATNDVGDIFVAAIAVNSADRTYVEVHQYYKGGPERWATSLVIGLDQEAGVGLNLPEIGGGDDSTLNMVVADNARRVFLGGSVRPDSDQVDGYGRYSGYIAQLGPPNV